MLRKGSSPMMANQQLLFMTNRSTLVATLGFLNILTSSQVQRIQKPPLTHPHHHSSSSEIVLEVVEADFYTDRITRNTHRQSQQAKSYPQQQGRERERQMIEKMEKEKKTQRNDKKQRQGLPPEKQEVGYTTNNIKIQGYPHPHYYPPYMYPPHPMQMGQYPHMYPPYYPMPPYPPTGQAPPFNSGTQPMQYQPLSNHHPSNPQNVTNQHNKYPPPPPPPPPPPHPPSQPSHYPDYMHQRQNEGSYQMHGPHVYPPPYGGGYNYPMHYHPYEYYQRQRQAHHREQIIRVNYKKEYIQELRNQLRRNVKDFNNQVTVEILEAVKCVLKFQPNKSPQVSPNSNTQAPLNTIDILKESISQRCYERSLQRIEKWLHGDNPNIREFMKGLLEAMQMSEIILRIKQLKISRKMQEQSLQSQSKRLLDILVRDPKKMIF